MRLPASHAAKLVELLEDRHHRQLLYTSRVLTVFQQCINTCFRQLFKRINTYSRVYNTSLYSAVGVLTLNHKRWLRRRDLGDGGVGARNDDTIMLMKLEIRRMSCSDRLFGDASRIVQKSPVLVAKRGSALRKLQRKAKQPSMRKL